MKSITISYPKTAMKAGQTPVTATLVFEFDSPTDTLSVWAKVPEPTDPKGYLTGEQQTDPGPVSEVGIENIEYMQFITLRVPSRIRLRRFRATWLQDIPYTASIIASYFDTDSLLVRQNLHQFG